MTQILIDEHTNLELEEDVEDFLHIICECQQTTRNTIRLGDIVLGMKALCGKRSSHEGVSALGPWADLPDCKPCHKLKFCTICGRYNPYFVEV